MDELIVSLKIALSNTFLMYFKAHSYHWNVEGMNFAQYHDYLGGLYEELHAAVDPMAEELRTLDIYGPISLTDLYRTKTVNEDEVKPADYREMVMNLISCNTEVVNSLNKTFELAEAQNKQGLADFIAGRIDVHNKHGWMLRSFLK
jgi:starvation-inducible DNA-binding protein